MPVGARLVLLDARGESVVQAWYSGPSGYAQCYDLTIDPDRSVRWQGDGGSGDRDLGPLLEPGDIRVTDHSLSTDGDTTYIAGRVGEAIDSVAIVPPFGERIQATVTNGWWGAWLPGLLAPGSRVRGLGPGSHVITDRPVQTRAPQ